MSVYCFECPGCDRRFEVWLLAEERNEPQRCPACRNVGKRDLAAEMNGTRHVAGSWPQVMDFAYAFHDDQICDVKRRLGPNGAAVEYMRGKEGLLHPVVSSRAQRRAFLKAMGNFDRDGGYSD